MGTPLALNLRGSRYFLKLHGVACRHVLVSDIIVIIYLLANFIVISLYVIIEIVGVIEHTVKGVFLLLGKSSIMKRIHHRPPRATIIMLTTIILAYNRFQLVLAELHAGMRLLALITKDLRSHLPIKLTFNTVDWPLAEYTTVNRRVEGEGVAFHLLSKALPFLLRVYQAVFVGIHVWWPWRMCLVHTLVLDAKDAAVLVRVEDVNRVKIDFGFVMSARR